MLFKSANPLSPSVEISLPSVAFNYKSIQKLVLDLGENKHDAAKIHVTGISPIAITDYLNSPVSMSWFQGNSGHEFNGYITHIEPEYKNSSGLVNGSPLQMATIYCLGASFDMKAKVTRAWNSVSFTNIVKEIANKYSYTYALPINDYKFDRLIQSGESDWEFLVKTASYVGYSVVHHGTHLHVFDRYRAVQNGISYHPISGPAEMTDLRLKPGQVLTMSSVFGLVTPTSNSNNEQITVLDNQNKVTIVEAPTRDGGLGSPLPPRFTDQVASSVTAVEYAQDIMRARSRKKYPFEATFELSGTSGVMPGGVLDLKGFYSNFNGLWYVSDVTQTLSGDKFLTTVKAIKDSLTPDVPISTPRGLSMRAIPAPTFVNGVWKSSQEMEMLYA